MDQRIGSWRRLRRRMGRAARSRTAAASPVGIILLLIKTAQERVAGFLLEMAERIKSTNEVELPMSRQDIADYLGLTIETVSRTLTRFEREKMLVIVTGGVRLLDSPRAEALAAA